MFLKRFVIVGRFCYNNKLKRKKVLSKEYIDTIFKQLILKSFFTEEITILYGKKY